MSDHEHVLNGECWCNPTVAEVGGPDTPWPPSPSQPAREPSEILGAERVDEIKRESLSRPTGPVTTYLLADSHEAIRTALARAEERIALCAICTPERDHAGYLCKRHADEKIIQLGNSLARAEERLADVAASLGSLEWIEEVDVNGEYTTTRWRPGREMKAEIGHILSALPSREDTGVPLTDGQGDN